MMTIAETTLESIGITLIMKSFSLNLHYIDSSYLFNNVI